MAKTVPVKPHKRSTPSPTPRKNPNAPKPGPKTVPVKPHKRSTPKYVKIAIIEKL